MPEMMFIPEASNIFEKDVDMAPHIRVRMPSPRIRTHLWGNSSPSKYVSKRDASFWFTISTINSLEAASKTGDILSSHIGIATFMNDEPELHLKSKLQGFYDPFPISEGVAKRRPIWLMNKLVSCLRDTFHNISHFYDTMGVWGSLGSTFGTL
jgi:hypothetical protein